jgi:gamma-glutamylcysteine synthetase
MFFKSDYILGYVEWALKANVLRIENLEMEKQPKFSELTFEDWVKKGPFKGIKASQKSWELHLTTLFPDIRLKNFFEFRNSDALPFQHSLVPAVFFSEVLYNEKVHENMNILLLSIFKSEDAFNQCHEINTLAKALINKEKECYHILNCPKKHLIILENLLMNIEQTEDYKLKVRILESFVNDYNKKQLFPESCLDFVKDNQIDKPSRLLKSLL